MTFTINPEYIYLIVTVLLMLIQAIQWRFIYKLRKEIQQIWEQISILAISASGIFEKFKKDIDGKQDK